MNGNMFQFQVLPTSHGVAIGGVPIRLRPFRMPQSPLDPVDTTSPVGVSTP